MIRYNFRYRGAFEYDKFVLTALGIANETIRVHKRLSPSSQNDVQDMLEDLDELQEEITSGEKSLSLSLMRLCVE